MMHSNLRMPPPTPTQSQLHIHPIHHHIRRIRGTRQFGNRGSLRIL
jgi:hypothetical protein